MDFRTPVSEKKLILEIQMKNNNLHRAVSIYSKNIPAYSMTTICNLFYTCAELVSVILKWVYTDKVKAQQTNPTETSNHNQKGEP